MSQLSEALHRANRRDLSVRDIERAAEKLGQPLSVATISRYMSGKHPQKPSPKVLKAFAAVFGVSAERLLADAELPAVGSRFELPAEADMLNDQERAAVVQLVRVMAAGKAPARPASREGATVHQLHPDLDHLPVAAYEDASSDWARRRAQDEARGEESQETYPED